jgi:uncharacterized protein Yka (UPF0111/DUF47 family)
MTNLWKDIKENVKQWSTAAIEKAEEVSKMAVEKTGDFTKISKIKLDIRQTQKDIDDVFEDLGRYVYLHFKERNTANFKTNNEFIDSVKKIDEYKLKIKDFEKEIDNIKKEVESAKPAKKAPQEPKTKTTVKKVDKKQTGSRKPKTSATKK